MKHKAELAHHVPGRLRIKIPTARGNVALLESMRTVFAGIEGIQAVNIKPDSGSLVLLYDPALEDEMEARFRGHVQDHVAVHAGERFGDEVDEMARKIEAEAEYLAQRSHWARVSVDLFKEVDRQLKIVSGNVLDLKIVLALGLAVVTFSYVGAEAATPMWITLVLFALNHFMETHPIQAQTAATA
jgi:hypothetical protein